MFYFTQMAEQFVGLMDWSLKPTHTNFFIIELSFFFTLWRRPAFHQSTPILEDLSPIILSETCFTYRLIFKQCGKTALNAVLVHLLAGWGGVTFRTELLDWRGRGWSANVLFLEQIESEIIWQNSSIH